MKVFFIILVVFSFNSSFARDSVCKEALQPYLDAVLATDDINEAKASAQQAIQICNSETCNDNSKAVCNEFLAEVMEYEEKEINDQVAKKLKKSVKSYFKRINFEQHYISTPTTDATIAL